ncbi:MAG: M1 family metallopeptidase [Steroidobacteraceae bacterium]|jgi:aminopeptidase N
MMTLETRALMLAAIVMPLATAAPAAVPAPAPAPAAGPAPFSFDAAPGRLPKNVLPLNYNVSITPNATALTFSGTESVQLQFRSATATLVFNSVNETLHDVRLDGTPVEAVVSDDSQQLTTVTLAAAAPIGPHRLTFSYKGKIEKQPHGLFAQPYSIAGGGQGLLLSTQMEATDARRVFPCWDEPAYRARFQLKVVVPANWTAVSNMPIANRVVHGTLATVTFQRSPKMPSYLVEFSAGDLAQITATSGGVKFGVWAVRGHEQYGKVALANAQQILADYNDYFGYPYPLPKLDSIAVPGGFSGAMENWGAITYNDQVLLITPASTIGDRQQVFSIQAHEMAHQWNGDLVTMGWWDDIWLNESFASWRAAKETELRNPSWKWWESEDSSKEQAMRADARVSSHAIQQHVTDELQVDNAFDPEITYNKGQAVLRMFEAYLGPDTFRDGIRSYIKAHAFSNATTVDLWNALSAASRQNIGEIAADWTEQAGFPLVTVISSCDPSGIRTIALSQRRFLLHGADTHDSRWRIPLQIRSGAAGRSQPVLLTQDGQKVSAGRCDEPLSVNADAIGFYRARYDEAAFGANARNFSGLPDGDLIALLDDQWALVESGTEPLATYLTLASAMGAKLDTRAWEQIAEALGTIEYDERGTPGHDAFAALARSIIKPVADQLGWDAKSGETPDVQRLRRRLLGDLGAWGDQDIIGEARRRFSAFVKDRSTIGPDDQAVILSVVMHDADAATYEQVHAMAKQAKDEAELERYYRALVNVRDPQLAAQVAQIALSPELPPQAVRLRLGLLLGLASEHHELAWSTFSNNAVTLLSPFPSFAPLIIAQYIPAAFWDAVPLDQLEAWVRSQVPAEMSANVDRGMESARFMLSEKQALVPAADAYVHSIDTR